MKKYPLLQSQLGVFLECQSYPNSTQYNLPYRAEIDKNENIDVLIATWKRLIKAHPILRVRFEIDENGNAWQWPDENMPVVIPVKHMDEDAAIEYMGTGFVRPFDILKGTPLFRLEFVETEEKCYMLMDFHHLIMDGLSYSSLIDHEFAYFFNGKEKYPDYSYFEIAEEEQDYFKTDEYSKARDYFVNRFRGEEATGLSSKGLEEGQLVTDVRLINKGECDIWCLSNKVDTQSLFQAAFAIALGRLSRVETPVYFTSYHGRVNRKMMRTYGMFVNNVALKANLDKDSTVADLLKSINEDSKTAYSMGRFPFSHLNKETGLMPRVSFNFRPFSQVFNIGDEKYAIEEIPRGLVQTDININIGLIDDSYAIMIESSDEVNSAETISMFATAIQTVIVNIMRQPSALLKDISLVKDDDAEALISLSTGEKKEYDTSKTWIYYFNEQVKERASNTAVVDEKGAYTYGQLDALSSSVAQFLIEKGIKPNDFIALKTSRTKDFVVAVLGIWKAGAAYIPIDMDYPKERVDYILSDSGAKLLLTDDDIKEAMKTEANNPVCLSTPSSYAYIIYTSGSTGKPKGVVIEQGSVLNLVSFIRDRWGHRENSRIACHSNFTFDASVEDLYPVLMVGGALYIVPESVRRDIGLMRSFIRDNGITGGCYTTQFGQLLGDTDEPLELDYIVLGGEKMTAVPNITGTVFNTYGPTEFTVDATYCEVERGVHKDIPIGRPLYNSYAFVLDAYGNLLPQGATGELCLSGPQVAHGYWNLPEKTKEVFNTVKFQDNVERRIYRTGDLVRYNSDRQLEYFGRIDFQIKLHGFRIELGEIDSRAMAFDGIKQAMSQVKEERIVLYYCANKDISTEELKVFMGESLAEYMVPSVFIQLDEMPLTINGKVDLKALPAPVIEAEDIVAPENELEAAILKIVQNTFHFGSIGVTTNLVSLGMSSLDTMRLSSALSKEFGSALRFSDIMKSPTVRGIARCEQQYSGNETHIEKHSERNSYPITENQRGVYLDWEMYEDKIQYNMPGVYLFDKASPEALKDALIKVFDAHYYLKTRLAKESGEVVLKPHKDETVQVEIIPLDKEPEASFFQERVKPFDLLKDRLYRLEIYTFDNKCWLFMDVHHIICDGLSTSVIMDDLAQALKGGDISEEEITAYDYAIYEREYLESSKLNADEEYFDTYFSDSDVVEYPDSDEADNLANAIAEYRIKRDEIEAFCKDNNITPSSFLISAFALALKRISRVDKPLFLTISNGRTDAKLKDTVGMFVKTLPVVYAGDDETKSVIEYINKSNQQLNEIYARDMVPFTRLVEKYSIRPQIMFAYQGGISDDVEGATVIPLSLDTAKFPVMVSVFPEDDSYKITVEYNGMRYSRDDMLSLVRAFSNAAINLTSEGSLRDVKLVDDTEADELMALGRGETLERDENETILKIFKDRAAKTPDAVAVVFHEKSYTYRQLDEISDRIAVHLHKISNIGPEENVGVLINRSELMMIYPLAIMKTGAAYMPLDPHFPTDRLTFMCEDANVRLILSEDNLIDEKLPDYKGISFYSKDIDSLPAVTEDEFAVLQSPSAHNRLVIIFTSGTTGKPKAVDLEHYGVVNYCHWYVKEFELTMADHVAGYANFGFDAHMIDFYPSFLAGSAVYLFDEGMRMDVVAMNKYMEANAISVAFLTTQVGCLISEMNHSLRYLSTGGEKMPPITPPDFRFLNVYGPTECSLFSTYYDVPGYFEGRLIGRPLSNYQLYIIDEYGQLVPRGASGELLIAGQGVARGYMNREELTAEKFINFKLHENSTPVRAYRSGDLVSWDKDGNIAYLGRIDKQVKLRGLRIELGEIENVTLSYPGIVQAVVDVKGEANPQLCCYFVSEESIDIDALKEHLSQTLTEFMIPQIFMRLDALPLNPNGKVDKKTLPEPVLSSDEIVEPKTEDEKNIFTVVASVLKNDSFGVTTNLISVGMSSIAAMRLSAALEERLNIKLRVSDIMKAPTIREMANSDKGGNAPALSGAKITHITDREYYPITENQRGLIIDWEMDHDTTQYNIPNVYVLSDMPAEKLADAVKTAVDKHPYLKTRIVRLPEDIMQQPHADESVDVEITALLKLPDAEFFQGYVLPFDIFNDKLYRFHIFIWQDKTYLFMDIHHIVYDGFSAAVFMRDILAICEGRQVEEEQLTAYDYAIYEKEFLESKQFSNLEKYFDELMDGVTGAGYPDSATPDISANYKADSDYKESKLGTIITEIEGADIDDFCSKYAVTTGDYMQAVVAEVYQSLTREEKPMYLTISNGRSADIALQETVGMYVRTLPVVFAGKGKKNGDESVVEYVKAVQKQLQMTFEREIYPYTRLVEKHHIHADIMVTWQGGMDENATSGSSEELLLSLDAAKLPILITTYPKDNGYALMLEYDRTRFNRKDMDVLLSCIKNAAITMANAERISDISFLSPEEEESIMKIATGDKLEFDRSKTWLSMFEHWVEVQPEHIAVTDKVGQLTYKELDIASDKLAAWLINYGVKPDDFVVIKMNRYKEFAVAVIGIHKAGACYVPIDPNYPSERIEYMEENSEAKVVLDEELIARIINTDEVPKHIDVAEPKNYAYMIYTSGSTGKPKGAIIPHSSLMNYVQVYTRRFEVTPEDRVSHHITFSFDSHIRDFYPALAGGASLHFMPDEITKEPDLIYEFLEKNKITGSAYATAMGLLMINGYDLKQRFISVGGEALIGVKSDTARVFNVCGATEVTDVVVDYELEKGKYYDSVPIGKPMYNTWAFIVDKNGHLLPQGVAGEICYAGLNIGAGYWKMPEKTRESFVDCPYVLGQRMYHTGDLGRYDEDGNVEYLGRLDFQVKLRGFRIELGEIESRAIAYPGMKQVAAAVKKDMLVLYYTAEEEIDVDALTEFMKKTLTAYMVPSSFMQLDKFPMTPSGKINRKVLPEPMQKSSVDFVAPETDEEKLVSESMQKILGLTNQVGAEDNFFELGGDSIKAIRMVSLIRQAGFKIQVSDIMSQKIVRLIASVITKEDAADAISQEPFTGKVAETAISRYYKYLELPDPNYYDQSTLWTLNHSLDISQIQQAVDVIALQHDMLRAIYKDGGLFVRDADAKITVAEENVGFDEELTKLCETKQASIDMESALVNVTLIHKGETDYLFMAAHHLVIDGVSWRIIASDLESALASIIKGEEISLPLKTNTYNDYAIALQKYRDSMELAKEIPYWEKVQKELYKLATSHEKDYGRKIESHVEILDSDATGKFIKANFGMMNADINDALLTAVSMAYYDLTKESSVSVQLEGHGREDIGQALLTDRTVGWFTSIYPVVLKNISGDLKSTFIEVKESLHRVPNKGVGFNVLRFLEGNTSFMSCDDRVARIGFNYLGEMDSEQSEEDSILGTADIQTGASISARNCFGNDISINALVENGRFVLYLTYNSALFEAGKIKTFASNVLKNMSDVAEYLPSMKEKEFTASDYGETEWSSREFRTVVEDFAKRGERITRIYPLTYMQEGMLFKYLSDPKSWAYKIVSIYELDVLPTKEQLTAAMSRLAIKHEVLRTAFIYDGVNKPRQAIVERKLIPQMVDISDSKDLVRAVNNLRTDILDNAFDMQRKPLFQVTCAKKSDDSCYIIISVHHAIMDGWCMGIYTGDLFSMLNEEITGIRTPDSKPEDGKYEKAVREILKKDMGEGLSYWKDLLGDYETKAFIPSLGEVPENEQSKSDAVLTVIDKETTDGLENLCVGESATISNGIELAWGLVLQTYSRTEDSVFGKVVSGRDNTSIDVSELVGLFINTVPVRVTTEDNDTARDMLRKLNNQAANTSKYDFCPLAEIQKQSALGSDLFQNVIAFENYDSGLEEQEGNDLSFSVQPVVLKEENFGEVTPAMYIDGEGRLCLNLTFDRKRYRIEEIKTVGKLFRTLIKEMVSNPDTPVLKLKRVGDDELSDVIALSKGDVVEYDTEKTWLSLFEEQVKRTPDALAVADENSSMTYKELDYASNQVACYLISKGVAENDFVAVKMSRRKEFVAVIFGIQKAGAAYVPIDMSYPKERIEYIEDDAGVGVILTEDLLDEIFNTKAEHVNKSKPDNFAYMIYTSGSTGKPKGAVIYQKGLMNFVIATNYNFKYSPKDRVSGHRSFSFDAHICDYYAPLCAGASVHIMPESIRKDSNKIFDFLKEHEITAGGYTTALAKILKNSYPLRQRFIACGGEALNGVVSDDVLIYNEYGPTECTCDATFFALEKGVSYSTVPIGRPVPNNYIFILDKNGNLLPQGVRGELCFAGVQVGYGYWNKPEMTEKVFGDCPFVEGSRMYHTGDLGYYDTNGNIVYSGRIDFQVKLHGFRIELGEIESRAAKYDGMKTVCAQVKKDSLVLYYSSEGDIDIDDLKKFMSLTLAEYMIPTVFIHMDSMPLTPNGKVNLRELPEPEIRSTLLNEGPANRLEENCLNIAKEILPGIEFGVTDNLTLIGLDSLKTMLFTSRISNELNMKLRVSDVMRYKTIRGFIQGQRRISWLYDEYDENKPNLVFTQGIVLLSDTDHLHKLLGEYFNLVVIEPIQNHYSKIFDGEHYDEVVQFYLTLATMLIPEDKQISYFMGFSFGGALSFGMAKAYESMTGRKAAVIMGDTTLPESGKRLDGPEITTPEYFRQIVDSFKEKEHDYTDEELKVLSELTNLVNVINSENTLSPYDGKVIFLNAMKNSTDQMTRDKMDALKHYASQADVKDFPKYSHSGLFSSADLHEFYRRLAEELLNDK